MGLYIAEQFGEEVSVVFLILFCFVLLLFLLLRKIFTDCYVKKVKRKSSEMEIYDKYDSMGLSLHINLEKNGFFSFLFLIKKNSFCFCSKKQTKQKQNPVLSVDTTGIQLGD